MRHTAQKNSGSIRHINLLVSVLIILSVGFGLLRLALVDPNAFPAGDSLWKLSLDVDLVNSESKALVLIPYPTETSKTRIVRQTFFHPQIVLAKLRKKRYLTPLLEFSVRRKGKFKLQLNYVVHISAPGKKKTSTSANKKPMDADTLQYYLKSDLLDASGTKWAENIVSSINLQSKDKNAFVNKAIALIKKLNHHPYTPGQRLLKEYDRSLLLTALFRLNQLPARVVTGLHLKESVDSSLRYWTQVYLGNEWRSIDPNLGVTQSVPRNYLPLRFNTGSFISTSGTQTVKTSIDISEEHDVAGLISPNSQSFWRIFDLTRLSQDFQSDLTRLLLLPFAVLLTAIIRLIFGIRCYGTFTPTLLALSLTYTHWTVAASMFLLVTVFAVSGRYFLPKSMPRVPRLSIVFTLVALGLVLGLSVLEFTNIVNVTTGVLLPIVILTSVIDRLYTTWEQESKRTALLRLFWTIVIAIICIPLVNDDSLRFVVLRFPELHFTTIAAILLLYQYKGPKLAKYLITPWLLEKQNSRKKQDKRSNAEQDI